MKNPKERSTAILVGVAAGAILMALMFMIVFGFRPESVHKSGVPWCEQGLYAYEHEHEHARHELWIMGWLGLAES